MSKFKEHAVKAKKENTLRKGEVKNFMNGNSFTINPLDTLKIVAASSIFGENSYYRESGLKNRISNPLTLEKYGYFKDLYKSVATTTEVFTRAIDASLDYDFKGTLELALKLRTEGFMRLNPAIIYIRASLHSNRVDFNAKNPGFMKKIGEELIIRPDDITNQFEYFMFLKGSKKSLPSLVKRTWASRLSSYGAYHIKKYKSKSLIDLVRISHANSPVINELMKTGDVAVKESDMTWETLKSQGKTWTQIWDILNGKIPHMALVRNLRGIFTEVSDLKLSREILLQLKNGVLGGKQFPFRYWSAYKEIQKAVLNNQQLVLDALEECIDTSVANMPKLEGKVACLSDNSGSAWGSFNSEYGQVTVAEIGNLSSLITSAQADLGEVGVFGDKLKLVPVSKRNGILKQAESLNSVGKTQGQSTENGIWLFWDEAIKKKTHYDTVFIYSDMQAGHGGLYGVNSNQYKEFKHPQTGHIDVLSLVEAYRKKVNPKVNVFTVQIAGYNNNILPENLYRGAVLGGWTGKEATYAKEVIDIWNQIEQGK